MANTYTVLLSELVSEFNLDFFYKSTDFDKIRVTVDDISRPGLHLAGFFDHYEPMRVYVCGTVETAYLQKLSPEERIIIFDHFLSYKCPALIFARGFQPMPECLEMAKKIRRDRARHEGHDVLYRLEPDHLPQERFGPPA